MHAFGLRMLIAAAVLVIAGCSGFRPPVVTEAPPDQSTGPHGSPYGDVPSYDNFPDSGR